MELTESGPLLQTVAAGAFICLSQTGVRLDLPLFNLLIPKSRCRCWLSISAVPSFLLLLVMLHLVFFLTLTSLANFGLAQGLNPSVRHISKEGTDEVVSRRFSHSPGMTLKISTEFAGIEILTNALEEITVEVIRRASLSTRERESHLLDSRPLYFKADATSLSIGDIEATEEEVELFQRGPRKSAPRTRVQSRYKVSLPQSCSVSILSGGGPISIQDIIGSVQMRAGAGRVRLLRIRGSIEGQNLAGSVGIEESNGPVRWLNTGGSLSIVRGSGSIEAGTSGGPVTVRHFEGSIKVESAGGAVVTEKVRGEIIATTGGGSFRLILPIELSGDILIETSGGTILVQSPRGSRFKLDADSGGGAFINTLPWVEEKPSIEGRRFGFVNGGSNQVIRLISQGAGIRLRAAE